MVFSRVGATRRNGFGAFPPVISQTSRRRPASIILTWPHNTYYIRGKKGKKERKGKRGICLPGGGVGEEEEEGGEKASGGEESLPRKAAMAPETRFLCFYSTVRSFDWSETRSSMAE